MNEVLAEALPLGVAIAASPFSIVPAILLLLTPRARATGSAYLAGWLLGIGASTTAFTVLASVIEAREESPAWVSWTRIVLGLVLIGLAVQQWRGRRAPKEPPAWAQSIRSAGPRKAFRLGVILSIANPKVLLLSAAAGLAIGAGELTTTGTFAAVVVFTVVAASSVAVPVGLYLVMGERMRAPLEGARDWLSANSAVVMAVVFLAIGVMVLVEGLTALA